VRPDAFLFGEGQSRVVVSINQEQNVNFLRHLEKNQLIHAELGRVTNGDIKVDGENWGNATDWKELYNTAIEKYLSKEMISEGL